MSNTHAHPTPATAIPLMAPDMHHEVQRTIDEHPEIDSMDEEQRGEIIDITAWRINGGIETPWGRKARSNDPNNPNLNTDGMTYLRPDGLFEIYDCISGIDGNATWDGYGPYAPGENGYWHPPMPVDDQPVPGPTPDAELVARVEALETSVAALAGHVSGLMVTVGDLAGEVAGLTAKLAEPLHAHGPVNLPIVLESLTSLRCIGDIDVDVKPGAATPPPDTAGDPPSPASIVLLKRILDRRDDTPA
jgi:hypothetical protein